MLDGRFAQKRQKMNTYSYLIETENLILRPFQNSDINSMIKNWISDPEIQKNYGEPVYSEIEMISELINKWNIEIENNNKFRWNILCKIDGESIGQIGVCHFDKDNNCIDIEYCIGKMYQNRGYATESVIAGIDYIFNNTKIERIQAFHRGKNAMSGKVLKNAGMFFEGIHRNAYRYTETGLYDDKVWYGIIKSDYDARRPTTGST